MTRREETVTDSVIPEVSEEGQRKISNNTAKQTDSNNKTTVKWNPSSPLKFQSFKLIASAAAVSLVGKQTASMGCCEWGIWWWRWYWYWHWYFEWMKTSWMLLHSTYFFGSSFFSSFLSPLAGAPVDKISLIFSNGWPLMSEATLAQPRCNKDLISM